MSTRSHPLPPSVAHELLQLAARVICDRPGESPAQRDSRTQQMVHLALAFDPRDGLEYMLSILAVGHFNLLMDTMREALQAPPEATNSRTRSTIVALDRAFLGLVKEFRLSRKRPAAQTARPDEAARSAPAVAEQATGAEASSPRSAERAVAGAADQRSAAVTPPMPNRTPELPGKAVEAEPGSSSPPENLIPPDLEPSLASVYNNAYEEALVHFTGKMEAARAREEATAAAGD